MSQNERSDIPGEQVSRGVNADLGAKPAEKKSVAIEETGVQQVVPEAQEKDILHEGKGSHWLDVDRMINEGLGSGYVGEGRTGEIDESRPLKEENPTPETGKG